MNKNKDKIFWTVARCVSLVLSLVCFGLTELYIFLLFKEPGNPEIYNWKTASIGILGCLACWWSLWFAYDNLNKVSNHDNRTNRS